jgi:hypothetical protein
MTRIIALLILASPAHADRITLHPETSPGAAHFARLAIVNRIGTYNETVTLDTAHGPVSVEYTTTPCTAAGVAACADTVCVVVAPEGVVPVPECAEIMERESGEILLMKWIGG